MLLCKKNIYIRKNKVILRVAITLIYLLSLIFYTNDNKLLYFRIIDIMKIVFIGAIILATNSKYSKNNRLTLYLGKGLIIIALAYISKYMILDYIMIRGYSYDSDMFLRLLGITIKFFEVYLMALIIKSENNKYEDVFIKKIILFAIGIISGIVIIINLPINIIDFYYRNAINYVLNLALYIYTYLVIFNNRFDVTERERRIIFLFINMLFISNLLSGFSYNIIIYGDFNIYTTISYAFSYFAYYFLYEGFIISSLEKYYNYIQNCILRNEENIKQKNIILKKRAYLLKELNDLVEKSKNYHNEFINSIDDFICIVKEKNVEYINEGALKLISESFDKEYLIKKLKEFYQNVILEETKNNGIAQSKFKLSLIDKFDETLDLELFYLKLTDGYTFILIKNITEEKRLKEKREQIKKYYAEEYLKREFFSNISHELRTPINVISSAIQLNNINLEEGILEKVSENNIRIRQNALRLIRTINNFIDVNRISENCLSGEYEICNIVELVETTLHCSKEYFHRKEMDFLFDTEEEIILIKIDKNFTERVILNIFSNCVKYGKSKGNVYIYVRRIKEKIEINIANDGKLIEEEEKNYIFDKFTKNKAFNRSSEGSGLGLYISKSLMELQGGSLEIKTDENNQNIFTITFKGESCIYNNLNMDYKVYNDIYLSDLMEKVDIEFSDIYYDSCS